MAIFAVMSPGTNPALGIAVARHFSENFYVVAQGQYLVAAQNLTTKEITERLGATSGELGQVIVLASSSYYGWHTKDVWEWIQVKS